MSPHTPQNVCGICKREMKRARRILDGVAYCPACCKRELIRKPCPLCGENVYLKPEMPPEYCKSCKIIGRKCDGCGENLPKASSVEGDKAYCQNCTIKKRDPIPCSKCGKVTVYHSKSKPKGITEPTCYACLSSPKATCQMCGKHRIIHSIGPKGKPICAPCAKRVETGEYFKCPLCNEYGYKFHSKEMCNACYRKFFFIRKCREWSNDNLKRKWVISLYNQFIDDYPKRFKTFHTFHRDQYMFRVQEFFKMMDESFEYQEDLTLLNIFRVYGIQWTFKYRIIMNFLVRADMVPPRGHHIYIDIKNQLKQLDLLKKAEGTWFYNILKDYYNYNQAIRTRYQNAGWDSTEKFKQKTILTRISSALSFLIFVKNTIKRVSELDSIHFFSFMKVAPGHKFSLQSFVYFLNTQYKKVLFNPVSLDYDNNKEWKQEVSQYRPRIKPVEKVKRPTQILSGQHYNDYLHKMFNTSPKKARDSLICLFAILYAQRCKTTAKLKLEDVKHDQDGTFYIKFHAVPLALDSDTSKVLAMYMHQRLALERRGGSGNPYLFIGSIHGSHIEEATILNIYRANGGIKQEVLFSTALVKFYEGGVTQPKALTNSLGICANTAMNYYQRANVRFVEEMKFEK